MPLSPAKLEQIKAEFLSKWIPYDKQLRQWSERKKTYYKTREINPVAFLQPFLVPEPVLPEYYPGYRHAVAMYDQIVVHADKSVFPEKLFMLRSPNETDKEYAYRWQNYKNTTNPVFADYINTVSRANADQNWSFKAEDDQLTEYINDLPKYGATEYFLRDILPTLKAKDANGIIAVEPIEILFQRDQEGNVILDEQQNGIISDEQVAPVPVYYSTRNIVAQEQGKWYAVISYEKSAVEYFGKPENMGLVVFIFDDENIYQFSQIGKYVDYQFSAVGVRYPHRLGRVNAVKLKGIPSIVDDHMMYLSPFSLVTDLLDLCLLDESNLQATKATTVFNYKIAVGTPCTFQRDNQSCRDGMLFNLTTGRDETCPQCNGSGLRPRMGPFGTMLINPGVSTSTNPDGDTKLSNYLQLVGPPVEAPKLLREEIEKNEYRARKILHLPDADSQVVNQEGKTATGSLNKARATFAFIKPISDQTFDIYEFIIWAINRMRFTDPKPFQLDKPQSFDIMTPTDQLAIIGELSALGLPPALITTHIEKYLSSLLFSNSEVEAAFKLLMQEDELIAMSRDDINLRLTAGLIESWKDTLHQAGLQLIKSLIEKNPNFLNQPYQTQREQLIQAAKDATKNNEQSDPRIEAEEQLRRIAEQTA